MYIKQLYTNCLAEAAYYIESEGQAAVIDPIRETGPYISLASERGAQIRYVFETHFHADFISGHIDLAALTGAQIVYGPGAETGYDVHNAKDGEEFRIGKLTLRVIHTPGHTLESTCYLLLDENEKEYCIFTGDTLFVGDVGRPDLLDGVMSKEELAAMMFESLNTKIKTLPDDVIVYPAHGPGSSCGKNIGKETWSTIGHQKKTNYALLQTDKDKFIETLITGLTAPPMYFFDDARINRIGYENVEKVVSRNTKPLMVDEFESFIMKGALVLDTRDAAEYEKASVAGSLNIGLNGTFAGWVGTLVHIENPLVLVTTEGKEAETVLRLSRVGYENVKGFLTGGIDSWVAAGKPVQQVNSVQPASLLDVQREHRGVIVDVRKDGEYEKGHITDVLHIPLAGIDDAMKKMDKSGTYYIHCAGGYRSMMAVSMMKANGFKNVFNVCGGFSKIKESGIPVEIPQPA